ncbi:MAG TPA: bifunctional molybdenum cofactor biosynthesis protein MoaC/MoaB [bacterium]|nr:bifunctional molybdenum cofactor biosynthesis protein MoaC/MoaB [bacterium]
MISIEHKIETHRTAKAEGFVKMAPGTVKKAVNNEGPKKDVFVTARVAGMMAAKRTPDLIPDCHPLLLEKVEVTVDPLEDSVKVTAEVACTSKTGVEMEALAAVSAACLTIYDMLKPLDKNMEITGIKLLEKTGGKSDFRHQVPAGFRAAVVTSSDRSHQGLREDVSGPYLVEVLKGLGVVEPSYDLLPDDKTLLVSKLTQLCEAGVDLILTTGGTGLSPRDVTVEAAQAVIEREVPGVMEAARAFGQKKTPYAMLSRGVAGQRGKTLLVTLPGSRSGCEETVQALFPALLHAFKPMKTGKPRPTAVDGKGEKCD